MEKDAINYGVIGIFCRLYLSHYGLLLPKALRSSCRSGIERVRKVSPGFERLVWTRPWVSCPCRHKFLFFEMAHCQSLSLICGTEVEQELKI